MSFQINSTIKDAQQTALVKLYRAEGKSYDVTATVDLTPELIKFIKSDAVSADSWLSLRANLFTSKEEAQSNYDGKAKPSKVNGEKVEYIG
jgi:hypothetical protein